MPTHFGGIARRLRTSRDILLALAVLAIGMCSRSLPADDDSGAETNPLTPGKTPASRGLNRERLKRFRERRGADRADISGLSRVSWTVEGVTREALVHVPPAKGANEKKSPAPLVFAFHGHGGRAEYSARKLPFHELWPEAVCIYPQGLPTPVPVIDVEGKRPGWQKSIGDQDDRDLKFFDAMLATMKSDHQIDERRIYVAGHSNGGFFTYVLCAARGEALAAVAPIAAFVDVRDFRKQKPIPVLHVAGEEDPIVSFAPQERSMEQLRKLNGCNPEGRPAGQFCTEYTSKEGPPVVTYIHPGGHEVPEGSPRRIVEFFQQHARK